jgi:hypothetical protein
VATEPLQADARRGGRALTVATPGPAADAARIAYRSIIAEKGHAVDVARRAVAHLDDAFDSGALQRTAFLDQALRDLDAALEQDAGQKLGGKSAEASRFILRAIDRMLDDA